MRIKCNILSANIGQKIGQGVKMREEIQEALDGQSDMYRSFIARAVKREEKRGSVLQEAINTINGERQDVYGNPEDSFALIGEYWGVYLRSKGYKIPDGGRDVRKDDVAMLMSLFKHAREAFQHKRDNIRDATGYLGIYADMQEAK